MIDSGESPKLQASWRETVWSDYDDALEYCRAAGLIDQARYDRFRRAALPEGFADQWGTEFVADGLGFYTALQLPPPVKTDPRAAYGLLQAAVELYFRAVVLVYRADAASDSHPPPTLRSYVIQARRRKDHRASWSQFLAEYWRAGHITSELLDGAMRKIGGSR
jgi:hypothetical protein